MGILNTHTTSFHKGIICIFTICNICDYQKKKMGLLFVTSELHMKMKSCIKEESQIALNVINNLKSKTASLNL